MMPDEIAVGDQIEYKAEPFDPHMHHNAWQSAESIPEWVPATVMAVSDKQITVANAEHFRMTLPNGQGVWRKAEAKVKTESFLITRAERFFSYGNSKLTPRIDLENLAAPPFGSMKLRHGITIDKKPTATQMAPPTVVERQLQIFTKPTFKPLTDSQAAKFKKEVRSFKPADIDIGFAADIDRSFKVLKEAGYFKDALNHQAEGRRQQFARKRIERRRAMMQVIRNGPVSVELYCAYRVTGRHVNLRTLCLQFYGFDEAAYLKIKKYARLLHRVEHRARTRKAYIHGDFQLDQSPETF